MNPDKKSKPAPQRPDLYNRHRPKNLDEVVEQVDAIATIRGFIDRKDFPRFTVLHSVAGGTGKTTLARLMAQYIVFGEPHQEPETWGRIQEVNCAAEGADAASFRAMLKSLFQPPIRPVHETGAPIRVLILNEIQKLSQAALDALLDIEDCPVHLWVIVTTTDWDKIQKSARSKGGASPLSTRIVNIQLKSVSRTGILQVLTHVCRLEAIQVSESVLGAIASAAKGSVRASLTLLESVRSLSEESALVKLNQKAGDDEYSQNKLVMGLTYGYFINPGESFSTQKVHTPSQKLALVLEWFAQPGDVSGKRMGLLGHINSMIGLGERPTPSPAVVTDLFGVPDPKTGKKAKVDSWPSDIGHAQFSSSVSLSSGILGNLLGLQKAIMNASGGIFQSEQEIKAGLMVALVDFIERGASVPQQQMGSPSVLQSAIPSTTKTSPRTYSEPPNSR